MTETTLTPDGLRELLESRWSELPPSSTRFSPTDDSFDSLENPDATLTVIERVRRVLDSESPVKSSFLLRIQELNQHRSHQYGDTQRSASLPSMPTAALKTLRLAETETEQIRLCKIRAQTQTIEVAESAYGQRDWGDLLLVGLVVLFTLAALVVELKKFLFMLYKNTL